MATIVEHGSGWRVQIRRKGTQAQSKSGFRTKSEAKAWARQVEAELDQGKRVDAGRGTFRSVLDAYTAAAGSGSSRSKPQALAAIGAMLGGERMNELTADRFVRFAAERRKQGAGPATIKQDLSYIGTVLRHGGILAKVSTVQPLVELGSARTVLDHTKQIARPIERTRRPTEEELQLLFAHWRRRPCREIPMIDIVLFAICSAMRLSEILRLDRTELDVAGCTILIRDRKHPKKKVGNHQRVPLLRGPVVLAGQVIDPLAIIHRQETPTRLIFPYRAASVSTAFTRAVQHCMIDDLHFHDLRHEGCSRLFEAKYTIEQVALVSGHEDWNMLRRYTKLKPESLHRHEPAESTNVVQMFPG